MIKEGDKKMAMVMDRGDRSLWCKDEIPQIVDGLGD
jgi:hypothetical protein